LREDGVDIANDIGSEWVFGAFMETIETPAVYGAQLEDFAHGDLLRGL
jgi:hypothetical protein